MAQELDQYMPKNENCDNNIQNFGKHPRVQKEEIKVKKAKKSLLQLDCFEDTEEQRQKYFEMFVGEPEKEKEEEVVQSSGKFGHRD